MAKKGIMKVNLEEYDIICTALNEFRSERIKKDLFIDKVDDALFGVFKKRRIKKDGELLVFKMTRDQLKVTMVALDFYYKSLADDDKILKVIGVLKIVIAVLQPIEHN